MSLNKYVLYKFVCLCPTDKTLHLRDFNFVSHILPQFMMLSKSCCKISQSSLDSIAQ